MTSYGLYIKSHAEAPDWESEIDAKSDKIAIDTFYSQLLGEMDRQWIKDNMVKYGKEWLDYEKYSNE